MMGCPSVATLTPLSFSSLFLPYFICSLLYVQIYKWLKAPFSHSSVWTFSGEELYHELHALDRFEQDYCRKLQEEDNPSTAPTGDGLAILWAELKSQRKHIRRENMQARAVQQAPVRSQTSEIK